MHAAAYLLTIDGMNISAAVNPILLQLEVELTNEPDSDQLAITLDDTGGTIKLPGTGAPVTLDLGYTDTGVSRVFEGKVDEIHSGDQEGGSDDADEHTAHHAIHGVHGSARVGRIGSRAGRSTGRTLTISCNAADTGGKLKERQDAHMDAGTFADAARQWAEKAGIGSCEVHADLASIQRPYWAIANESFWAWGARMAREIGATFKVNSTAAVFVPRIGNLSPSGQTLTGLRAVWGDNLIECQIAPVISRPSYQKFIAKWYDAHAAEWKTETAQPAGGSGAIGSDAAAAAHVHPFKMPDQAQAQQQAQSNADEADRESGSGDYVVVDGDPSAQPQAQLEVAGVRPGVDGTYTVSKVVHSLNRASGFLTQMAVTQPGGGAGSDDRTGATSPSAAPTAPANDATSGALKTGANGLVVGPV